MYINTSRALFTAHLLFLSTTASFTCQPGQSCWPNATEWEAFNQTVSGRLRVTVMLESSCFPNSPDYNNDTCSVVLENWGNGAFREQSYGSMEIAGWEACGTSNCYPGLYPPQGLTCSLGRLSALYVDAETTSDIIATLEFVKKYGIRLVLRNTGHDCLGRSAAANTLALRTFNFKNMEFQSSFTATNCSSSNKQNVGIIGAGVTAEEAVEFFLPHGMMVTTGGCTSVGIAGGFGQGGGHGPLGPTYGLMVDQAVEFDVITTDGVLRTVNQCNDPDLFWAMRGGGGQSYGILINYKFQVHPSTQWATYRLEATVASNSSNVTQNTVLRDVITALSNNQVTWTKNHVSGYDVLTPTSVTFLEILPSAGDALGMLKNLTSEFNAFLTNLPGINITMNTYNLYSDEAGFYAGEADYLDRSSGVGNAVLYPSRLITSDHFDTPSNINSLVISMLQGLESGATVAGPELPALLSIVLLKTSPFNTPDPQNMTSANPTWRDTIWHLISSAGWLPGTPDEYSNQASAAARASLDPIKNILSVQASYLNEADWEESDWQQVYFGQNYNRLAEIKKKYDPDSILNCWKCVNWLGAEDPMFSCYGNSPVPSTPYPFST